MQSFLSITVHCTGCPILKCAFWKCSCSKTAKHIDRRWWFLKSQDNIFWYSCLTFAKKKKEISKILIWKKILFFLGQKFFWNFFWKFFFALNQPKKGFRAKKFFQKISKKNWWYKNFFFLQMKIFIISFFFFAKVRHEYQNILCWLFKNHHFRSIWLTVFLQEHFQKAHFNIGHPVCTIPPWKQHGFWRNFA